MFRGSLGGVPSFCGMTGWNPLVVAAASKLRHNRIGISPMPIKTT
jgi:hypothetical protein